MVAIFTPQDCSLQIRTLEWYLCINGEFIECVDRFKYLGFWFTSDLSHTLHEGVICSKFRQVANVWGPIFFSMKCTNLSSLRVYFTAFVRSQLYGSIFVTVRKESINKVIGIFIREAFSLPKSFPSAVSRALLGLESYLTSIARQCVNYFR